MRLITATNKLFLRVTGGRLQRLKDGAARRARKAISAVFGGGREGAGAEDAGPSSESQPGYCTTPSRWSGADSGSSPEIDPGQIRGHPIQNLRDMD